MQAWQAKIISTRHTSTKHISRVDSRAPIKGMEYSSMSRPMAGKVCSKALSLQTL